MLNTPPSNRKSWSAARAPNASRKLPHTVGMSFSSSGGKSYRSLSIGSPGWILFLMPSSAAMVIAENDRYGLQPGSGKRTSTRLAFGLVVYGMRHDAERLRAEYASRTGAS